MLKHAKSAGRISRPDYECCSQILLLVWAERIFCMQQVLDYKWKRAKSLARNLRPDHECGSVQTVQ